VHHGHTQSPIGTFKSDVVKQLICHLLEQWSQTNTIVTPHDYSHNMHHKLVGMMDPLCNLHMKGDIVHDFAHGLSTPNHPDLPTTKPLKVKPSSHIDTFLLKHHIYFKHSQKCINGPFTTFVLK
jgi:hypothetical protein